MFNAGDIIGNRYCIQKLLGQGNFAQVWEVFDQTENTTKALKVLTQEGDKAIELFEQEAAALNQLAHPSIPKFFAYFEQPKYCFVMEKIEGCNLEKVKANSVSPLILINWLKELVDVLVYIHQQNYIHRDIQPKNIIVNSEGKLTLIDFGAVKKIDDTHLQEIATENGGTIIGRPGYISPEQTDGKALPQSDYYSLGYIFIFLLTGKHPFQLNTEGNTWLNQISPSLSPFARLLMEMVDVHPEKRPINEILQRRLTKIEKYLKELEKDKVYWWRKPVKVSTISMAISIFTIIIRQAGMLEWLELKAYDWMMRSHLNTGIDERLLIVEITQEERDKYHTYTIPDGIIAEAITKLQSYTHKPRVIGINLDLHLPVPPGREQLTSLLTKNKNIIGVCSHKQTHNPDKSVNSAPQELAIENRVGFDDFFIDNDGIVRRHLLAMNHLEENDPCQANFSFSFELARKYLDQQSIKPEIIQERYIKLGKIILKKLENNMGGYRNLLDGEYQILVDYRYVPTIRRITLNQLLTTPIDSSQIEDKIVIISSTAPPLTFFATSYYPEVSETILKAQMTSQLINAALGKHQVLWVWLQWWEIAWICGWSILAGAIAFTIFNFNFIHIRIILLLQLCCACGMLGVLYKLCLWLLMQSWWVPFIPSALVVITTSTATVSYIFWRTPRYHKYKFLGSAKEERMRE